MSESVVNFADKFAKRELNGAQAFLDVFVFDVNHDNIVPRTGSHLCDAVAHLSCADYTNALNHVLTGRNEQAMLQEPCQAVQ